MMLRLKWHEHPTSERIVEDISRLPVSIEQTIAHKGCQVPEEAIHKKGCRPHEAEGRVARVCVAG